VTELTQPMSDVSPVRQVQAQPRGSEGHPPSFTELVYAHHDWWQARQAGTPDSSAGAVYDSVLGAFEARHGRVVHAFWCSHVESAVALTEKRRLRGLLAPVYGFHQESDWATKNAPDVASELHRCDTLAVRAKAVLTGVRQRICLELAASSVGHLLSLVDERAGAGDKERPAAALEREHAAISRAESYYNEAANGQAQLVYFGGIATVTLALAGVAAAWLSISWAAPVAALAAGAVGAFVSVIQRINSGKFELEYDVGGRYAFFLGGLRPLIGGAFAMVITFAFDGGLLHLPVSAGETTNHRRLALLVLAFLAGFSERWAQDTLTSVLPAVQRAPAPIESQSSAAVSPPPPGASSERSGS
jgi:hypothetical protein